MTNLFGHSVRSELLLLYVAEALACFVAVYLLLALGIGNDVSSRGGATIAVAAVFALLAGLISGASGLYQTAAWSQTRRLWAGVGTAAALIVFAAFLFLWILRPAHAEGTIWTGLAQMLLVVMAAFFSTRLGFAVARRSGLLNRRLAVVQGEASSLTARAPAAEELRRAPFEIAVAVPPGAALEAALAPETLRARRVWAVIADDPAVIPPALRTRCGEAGVKVMSEDEFREGYLSRVDVSRLPADWLASARANRETRIEAGIRRAFDLALGVSLLLFTLPVLLLTALAIKLDSRGPVFYHQDRVGKDGRPYRLYKFRSMRTDAEAGGAPKWAVRGDPRVTRVGRFIRLTRIDEIPQVLNVLLGDMAFIGPRPERPAFVEQLSQAIPHYADRACVRPGITGWAQVNYPYGASVEDARMKLAYDLYYIRRRSLFLDLLILVATVRVVLFGEGAR